MSVPHVELTPTQQAQADGLAAVLARKFEIQPGDFGVVPVNGKPLLMMTAKAGLPTLGNRGGWEQIFDPDSDGKEYALEINGRQVDTRKGMTVAAYDAFVAQAAARHETPGPDSPEMAGGVNEFMRSTLLTGEDDGWARYAVNRGKALVYKYPAFKEWTSKRFRPAVILSAAESDLADDVAAAIAAKFDLARQDLGTVLVADSAGGKQTAVFLNTANGVYRGQWVEIFAPGNDEKFLIDVGGTRFDTRDGMTKAVYEAFIAQWQASGAETMPDSVAPEPVPSAETGSTAADRDWRASTGTAQFDISRACSTFLTGERGDHLERYASWSGKISIVPLDPTLKKGLQTRWRPAVWLDDLG
jgi:hypothetical protein